MGPASAPIHNAHSIEIELQQALTGIARLEWLRQCRDDVQVWFRLPSRDGYDSVFLTLGKQQGCAMVNPQNRPLINLLEHLGFQAHGECYCGCRNATNKGRYFRPGHDRRLDVALQQFIRSKCQTNSDQ